VPRRADEELLAGLQAGDFCYVLTSRQRGKSSLMIRTAQQLRKAGSRVVVLDLTRVGQNLTPEQWYLGLLDLLGESLQLQAEVEAFWEAHQETGPLQRWFNALTQVALPSALSPLVIFVDEIDGVKSLPFSTDEFFAAIRECYNRRTQDPQLNRLTFCLLGVASPADLIRDPCATPFNVGRRVELTDFTTEEAGPLGSGLHPEPAMQRRLLKRILYWTNGHPYLTQRLCATVGQKPQPGLADVDQGCKELFLGIDGPRREDNLLFVSQQLLRRDVDRARLLELYRQVRSGKVVRDEPTEPLVEVLRLSGITRSHQGRLLIRNRIYERTFDKEWISESMPESELRRQRAAFRQGLKRGLSLANAALLIALAVWLWHRHARNRDLCEHLGDFYNRLQSYSDSAVIKAESGPLAMGLDSNMLSARPNKFRMEASVNLVFGEIKFQFFCNGDRLWIYVPALNQYMEKAAPPNLMDLVNQGSQTEPVNDVLRYAARIYELVLTTNAHQLLQQRVRGLRLAGSEDVHHARARVFTWDERREVAVPQGDRKFIKREVSVPTKVWARESDGAFVKSVTDLSSLGTALALNKLLPLRLDGSNMVATAEHRNIRLNPDLTFVDFTFHPPPGAQLVGRLDFAKLFPFLR
jgi:outer membrane lipoprotein-sorting protein